MPFVKVYGDLFSDNTLVLTQQIQVARAGFGGEFERDMQQLANIRIKLRMGGDVSQSIRQARPIPGADRGNRRQLFAVDVNHAGVRRAQFINVFEGTSIDFLGQGRAVASSLSQPNELFEPCSSGCFYVNSRTRAL